jgi:hypothetical protein
MSKTFSKAIDKNYDVRFSSSCFLVFSRFRVFLSDGSSKAIQKTFCVLQKKRVKHLFFPRFLLSRFWAFLGEGSSKTPPKYFCKKSMSKTVSKTIDKNYDAILADHFCTLWQLSAQSDDASRRAQRRTSTHTKTELQCQNALSLHIGVL